MSYTNSPSPQSDSSPAVLRDSSWRMRHSAWLLAPILGLGVFGCIGFIYIAARTRSRKLWTIAAIYCAISVVVSIGLTVAPSAGPLSTAVGVVLLALWVGGTIHGVILNREYLRWRATSRPWYASAYQGTMPTYGAPLGPPQQTSAAQPPFGLNTQQYFAPAAAPAPAPTVPAPAVTRPPEPSPRSTAPSPKVDINTADAAALARIPGLDAQWAAHIVTVRTARNGFSSIEDFTAAVGIQPHHLVRVRDHLMCSPVRPQPSPNLQPPTRGRIVDF